MPTLVELATQLVTAQSSVSAMTTDEILSSLTRIHSTLGQLESNGPPVLGREAGDPGITMEKVFRKNEVTCMICGKSFRTLGTHLSCTHDISSKEYRKRFGIPKTQPLAAKVYVDLIKQHNGARAEQLAKNKKALQEKALADKAPESAMIPENAEMTKIPENAKRAKSPESAESAPAVEVKAQKIAKVSKKATPDKKASGKVCSTPAIEVKADKMAKIPKNTTSGKETSGKVGRPRKINPVDVV